MVTIFVSFPINISANTMVPLTSNTHSTSLETADEPINSVDTIISNWISNELLQLFNQYKFLLFSLIALLLIKVAPVFVMGLLVAYLW